jgi:Uri superfamily endonuclease
MILVSGFGSSDCSCASHLYFFQDNPDSRISRLKIAETLPQFYEKDSSKPQIREVERLER